MSIDVFNEETLNLNKAAGLLPERPHASTLWRWYKRGLRGIKLETIVIGGVRHTSKEALQRFIDRTTAEHDGIDSSQAPCRKRAAAIAKAEAELEAAGI